MRYSIVWIFVWAVSCTTGTSQLQLFSPAQVTRARSDFVADGTHGAVATAHPLASDAAITVLKDGGNAIDAAIAASFVISVVRPQSTGIGGGGFLVLHDAKTKQDLAFDFRERAPAKATRDMYIDAGGNPKGTSYRGNPVADASVNGHLSVGTPGLVRGLEAVHRSRGRLPWNKLLAPAIKIAEEGFPVYESLAAAIAERQEILSIYPSSKAIFIPVGKPLQIGERLVQKDLAWSLRQISEQGANTFYQGAVAEKIVAEMKRGNGIVSAADLKNYRVKERTPVAGSFRGYRIVSMPPPSSGGVHLIQMLNILEGLGLKAKGPQSPDGLHLIAEAMRRAFADRAELLGDPDFVKVPTRGLLSRSYAEVLRKSIDTKAATKSSDLGKSTAANFESSSTTHLSIVDGDGNAVSSTQTVNYTFGSGVVAEGTGIVLNDEMDDFSIKPGVPNAYGLVGSQANAVAANKTMLSSMSPTIVLNTEGKVFLVAGSPGGPRIISATFLTILNALEYGMTLPDAVHAARIHHQYLPDSLRVEKGTLPTATINALKKKGHEISEVDEIGDVQAIIRTTEGWQAVSDTRSEGKPAAY